MRPAAAYLLLAAATALPLASAAESFGRTTADAGRVPQSFLALAGPERAAFDLGLAVFNTQWVASGVAGAGRRDGLGPLFDSAACDACHNSAARGRGPQDDGPLPQEIVVQLQGPAGAPGGDPVYGDTLSRSAIDGFMPEARVAVRYTERAGQFPDGEPWNLRVPELRVSALASGPLHPATVLKPRIAPALFGVGLLEAVPPGALASWADPDDRDGDGVSGRVSWPDRRAGLPGRFGWEAAVTSVRAQTGRAFARDMGLTSGAMGDDDCGRGHACYDISARAPEVGDDLLAAIVTFQQALSVPVTPRPAKGTVDARGKRLFAETGCAACHRPVLPVSYRTPAGETLERPIESFTDLLLHDLGPDLADRTVDGRVVRTEWRTAPLWGQQAGARPGQRAHLLHDGRARSVSEAILWHGGEAGTARDRYIRLDRRDRELLSNWVGER